MASLQDIRHRIKSVKSTKQITSAMNMVATSRLRHAKEAATSNRPYAEKVSEVVHAIAQNAGVDFSHPLLETHPDGKKLIFLITSDKGLAGAYSSNACKAAEALVEKEDDTEFVIVGRKGVGYFKSRGHKVIREYIGTSERPTPEKAREISLSLIDLYKSGKYREVTMIYTKFISAISCEPQTGAILPFAPLESQAEGQLHTEYIYEPDAATVLGFMLPQYLFTVIYAALLQSAASELSSRMNAMSNATDNAEDLMDKLNLHYNKVRQAGITREITEIVGGAEALK
ncbi:ATP synthase F1 subunit gamma [Mitsuokella sp.]|uniref:ATP synthase F1 subunit gamma n=1 Tax=Mitsuokella TaxID=52225 RepID=UPI0029E3C510|nr:ATP synthase F1 subunit gamma [Mitsuokella sp.]MDD6382410.1 ATP synthase F1 subunit gamma [Selenomonadaceae bacterium]MDY4474291.1 ATP synthase F1 subunit gamma [Mitsuokella sp.]